MTQKNKNILDSPSGKSELEAHDSKENSPTPIPPKIDLRDAHAIRRELAAVYRDMRAGRIKSSDGTRLAYVLDMIRKSFETGVLQDRLECLERTFATRKAGS